MEKFHTIITLRRYLCPKLMSINEVYNSISIQINTSISKIKANTDMKKCKVEFPTQHKKVHNSYVSTTNIIFSCIIENNYVPPEMV